MTGKNLVGFQYSSEGDLRFKAIDPRDNSLLPQEFHCATENEAQIAVRLAVKAFDELLEVPLNQRANFLEEIANGLEKESEPILSRYSQESGLPLTRGKLELARTILQLRSFAKEVVGGNWMSASIDFQEEPTAIPDLRKISQGIGPVVVFGASNFPLAYSTAGGDTASAFAAGCPVIVKAHPMHPGTSELVALVILKAAKLTGMPEGVFSHLFDQGFKIGQQLVLDPGVKAVGFTGSIVGGRALMDLAASRIDPIPVFAEMGSVNPVFVLKEAKNSTEDLAEKIIRSISSGAGQFCTKPGLIFVLNSELNDQLVEEMKSLLIDFEPETMLHQTIYKRFEEAKGEVSGANLSQLIKRSGTPELNKPFPSLLIVDGETFLEKRNLSHEVFGPFSVVVKCSSKQEMFECLNQMEGQLTASFFGTDHELLEVSDLIRSASKKVGRLIFNGVPTGVTVCPSMNHGGTYPAASDSRFTAVGIDAMKRFLKPVVYQNCPNNLLPVALKDENELGLLRRVNGEYTRQALVHKKH